MLECFDTLLKMSDLSVTLAGIKLKNPLILASGIMGVSAASLSFIERQGAGAVTIKSIGPKERKGHTNPTIYAWPHGLINAVGLSNPGIEKALLEIKKAKQTLKIPLFVSCFAGTIKQFVEVAEKIVAAEPALLELNLSCPNTEDDFGKMFALSAKETAAVVRAVKKVSGKLPVFVKLTPDATDISDIAKAAEAEGADGITAVNSVSGLIIDIYAKRPILTNKFGGVSGPAIKPIALRAVYNIYKAVKLPIIGLGGVTTGEDAIEFIMAGATAVGIGSAVYYRGAVVFKKVLAEIREFMQKEGYKSLAEIRGIAHEY